MDMKEKVFLDDGNRPYLVREWGTEGRVWLFYWHPEGHWTSLREVKPLETFPDNLTKKEQDMYHEQHSRWEDKWFKDLENQLPD